jgi:hypothetical protein
MGTENAMNFREKPGRDAEILRAALTLSIPA